MIQMIDTLSARDNYGMDLAIKSAKLSDCRFAHGASILRGRKVVSFACNKIKTHPTMKRYGSHVVSIHAENFALIHAQTDLVGCVLYSARISRTGQLLVSKPCATCEMLIKEAGIRWVVYFNGAQYVKERYY